MSHTADLPMNTTVRLTALLALSAFVGGCTHLPRVPPAAPTAEAQSTDSGLPSLADLVQASLPSVVLLLNTDGQGGTTFGAGFLIEGGRALTSLHVVDGSGQLSALLYDPDRATYTPMDGGLGRVIFENAAAIVPGRILVKDAVSDLAIVLIEADTSALPVLPWSPRPLRQGERVLARQSLVIFNLVRYAFQY